MERTEPPSVGRTLARIFLFLPRRVLGLASRLFRLLRTGKWEAAVSEGSEEQFPLEDAKELISEAASAVTETAQAVHDVAAEAYHEVERAVHEVFESEHEHRGEEEPAPTHYEEEPAEEIIEAEEHHHDE